MFRFLQRKSRCREIYFHEDDYCQQQFLPMESMAHVVAELKTIDEFSDAHRVPGGFGWTDIDVRQEGPVELRTLKIKREDFAAVVSPFMPAFDVVYTGYSSYRKKCERTAAWGRSQLCAFFANWDEDGTIAHVWANLFDREEDSIRAASKTAAAIGRIHQLVYVDWAWGYKCVASEEEIFTSTLRTKFNSIAENAKKRRT